MTLGHHFIVECIFMLRFTLQNVRNKALMMFSIININIIIIIIISLSLLLSMLLLLLLYLCLVSLYLIYRQHWHTQKKPEYG